jgi:hypothetical protein
MASLQGVQRHSTTAQHSTAHVHADELSTA